MAGSQQDLQLAQVEHCTSGSHRNQLSPAKKSRAPPPTSSELPQLGVGGQLLDNVRRQLHAAQLQRFEPAQPVAALRRRVQWLESSWHTEGREGSPPALPSPLHAAHLEGRRNKQVALVAGEGHRQALGLHMRRGRHEGIPSQRRCSVDTLNTQHSGNTDGHLQPPPSSNQPHHMPTPGQLDWPGAGCGRPPRQSRWL